VVFINVSVAVAVDPFPAELLIPPIIARVHEKVVPIVALVAV